jgi:hypothetical protein
MTNGAPQETPQLTELQRVKLENFTLKHINLQSALNANMAERAAFCKSIVDEHPGYMWRDPDGLMPEEKRPFMVEREAEEPLPVAPPPQDISGNRKPRSVPSTK